MTNRLESLPQLPDGWVWPSQTPYGNTYISEWLYFMCPTCRLVYEGFYPAKQCCEEGPFLPFPVAPESDAIATGLERRRHG